MVSAKMSKACRCSGGRSTTSRLLPVRPWPCAILVAAGCAGTFQQDLPEQADAWRQRAAVRELRVGAAEADITPAELLYLGGFGMNRRATGVHSPLKARALVLQ